MQKKIHKRYFLAAALIGAFSTISFALLHYAITTNETTATVINVAGRQRMLSQRIQKQVLAYKQLKNEAAILGISRDVNEMRIAHNELTAQSTLPREVEEAISIDNGALINDINVFLDKAEEVASGAIDDLTLDTLSMDKAILPALEKLVDAYERASTRRIKNLIRIEIILFVLTILFLGMEVLLVFIPVFRKLDLLNKSRERSIHDLWQKKLLLNSLQQNAGILLWQMSRTDIDGFRYHRPARTNPGQINTAIEDVQAYDMFDWVQIDNHAIHPDDHQKFDQWRRDFVERNIVVNLTLRLNPQSMTDDIMLSPGRTVEQWNWYEIIVSQATLDTDSNFTGILHNVDESYKAQKVIEENGAFLSAVLETVDNGIVACDETGKLILFNRAARALHGMSVQSGKADDWATDYDLFHPDGIRHLQKEKIPLFRALSGEYVVDQAMVIAPKDLPQRFLEANARPLFDKDGKMLGAVASMSDKTELNAREQAIVRQNVELDMILNNIPVRIWFKDDENRIIRLNKAAADSMGLTVEECTGANTYDLFPLIAEKYHRDDLAVITSGVPLLNHIEEFIPSEGERGWVSTNKIPYYDPQKRRNYLFVASTDITKIKEASEQLESKNSELEQFAKIASHDLQEPLCKIMIFGDFLRDNLGSKISDQASSDLDVIQSSAGRMKGLVQDILELSRLPHKRNELQSVSPRDCIMSAMEILPPVGDDVDVIFDPGVEIFVKAHEKQLSSVYQNLIANAMKFMAYRDKKLLHFTAEIADHQITLGVKDSGIGIEKTAHEAILSP